MWCTVDSGYTDTFYRTLSYKNTLVMTKFFFVNTNKTTAIRTPFIRTLGYKNTPFMVPRGTFNGYKITSVIRTPLKTINGYKNTLYVERTENLSVLGVLIQLSLSFYKKNNNTKMHLLCSYIRSNMETEKRTSLVLQYTCNLKN